MAFFWASGERIFNLVFNLNRPLFFDEFRSFRFIRFCRFIRQRRCRHPRFGAEPGDRLDARTLVPAGLGVWGSIEFHESGERSLVLFDQGRAGADALRDVPRSRAVRRVHAA